MIIIQFILLLIVSAAVAILTLNQYMESKDTDPDDSSQYLALGTLIGLAIFFILILVLLVQELIAFWEI
jgi:hypothetical protein